MVNIVEEYNMIQKDIEEWGLKMDEINNYADLKKKRFNKK
jgi:hypothetical protein